jgi:hypothetical protein
VPRGPGANLSDGLTGTSDIPGLYGRPPTILILAGAPQGHPDRTRESLIAGMGHFPRVSRGE